VSSPDELPQQSSLRGRLLSGAAAAALTACIAVSPASAADPFAPILAAEPFLTATGASGILREQEAELFKLRTEVEGEVRQELDKARVELEEEGRSTQIGKLCATPFGVDIVGITEVVALIGALVGGVTARQRKDELERLNEQLRKINMGLRQQARAGTIYAPGLTYVPAGPGTSPMLNPLPVPEQVQQEQQQQKQQQQQQQEQPGYVSDSDDEGISAWSSATAAATVAPFSVDSAVVDTKKKEKPRRAASMSSMMSMDDEELTAEQRQCTKALREGKRLLKEDSGAPALVHFEKALMLAKFLRNKVAERRAVRGLAAASRLQGQYQSAIKHLQRVLEISREMGDHVGDADAYGTIADIYTDMGDLEAAAKNYDKYIDAMATDGPV